MSIELEQSYSSLGGGYVIPATSSIGKQHLITCPGCGNKTILFSRTIQTFCFACGEAVTRLDKAGMYYVAVVTERENAE